MSTLWNSESPPEMGKLVIVELPDGTMTFARRVWSISLDANNPAKPKESTIYVANDIRPLKSGIVRWCDPVSLAATP